MKKAISGFIVGALLFTGLSATAASNFNIKPLKFFLNGEEKTLSYGEAINYNGRTYIPVRDYAEWMDTPVYWNGNESSVSIGKPYVELVNVEGAVIGGALLSEEADGVKIVIKASKLTPGLHGFHIHSQQFTGSDFKSAAGHFNPEEKKHGLHNPEGHHLGDMPNLKVESDGTVHVEVLVPGVTLEKDKPNSILGKSLIIHAGEDDGLTDPAGNSGDRVAGGNIGK